MKNYILGLFCLVSTLLIQYAISWLLIIYCYFSPWIYACGGFIAWIIVFVMQCMFLEKVLFKPHTLKYPKNIQHAQASGITGQVGVVLLLVGSFMLNIRLGNECEQYEFGLYGREVEGTIVKKDKSRTGKGAKIPYFVCSFLENQETKKIEMVIENDTIYALKKVGDKLRFKYSTRSHRFFKIIK
jgi:hypothetical protein